jgi:hypothetical protein
MYTEKKVSGFPVPARESLVSDIPAGDGRTANLFLQCRPAIKLSPTATVCKTQDVTYYCRPMGHVVWPVAIVRQMFFTSFFRPLAEINYSEGKHPENLFKL